MSLGQLDMRGNDRVTVAIQRLRENEPIEGYYLAYSGGKDSTVLLDLARQSGVKFDAHYNHTTADPPELVRFIHAQPDVACDMPDTTMWALIVKKRMPPTRTVRYCCHELKERGGNGRVCLTGIRWQESSRRSKRGMSEACRTGHKVYLHPIIDWSSADVWEYIRSRDLDYCSLYDEGFKRLGCVMCPMQGNTRNNPRMADDAARWPMIADAYQRAFGRMLRSRIEDGLKTETWAMIPGATDFENGAQIMAWWLEPTTNADGAQAAMEV